jgi:hypothetical protein
MYKCNRVNEGHDERDYKDQGESFLFDQQENDSLQQQPVVEQLLSDQFSEND